MSGDRQDVRRRTAHGSGYGAGSAANQTVGKIAALDRATRMLQEAFAREPALDSAIDAWHRAQPGSSEQVTQSLRVRQLLCRHIADFRRMMNVVEDVGTAGNSVAAELHGRLEARLAELVRDLVIINRTLGRDEGDLSGIQI